MKTKIIYISGAEVFDMGDVRAAFEEVRGALGLGADTILFGVPVDADSAIAVPDTVSVTPAVAAPVADVTVAHKDAVSVSAGAGDLGEEVVVSDDASVSPAAESVAPDIDIQAAQVAETEEESADAVNEPVLVEEVAPAPKKRGRPRRAKVVAPADDDAAAVENVDEAVEGASMSGGDETDDADAPIPILSILASGGAADNQDAVADASDEDSAAADIVVEEDVVVVADIDVEESAADIEDEDYVVEDVADVDAVDDAEPVSVEDMISEEAPVDMSEKTLEELLETMAPLQEDVAVADTSADAVESGEGYPTDSFADTDATLEQLAAEFAQNEDKIGDAPKNAGRGKIGKLKNILPLPFSNKRRDNNGLMGDLFGWAGIAANDDDFSIPGFFTPNASNNRG